MNPLKNIRIHGEQFKFRDDAKVPAPEQDGTSGQILRTNGDGTTRWDNAATQEEIGAAVEDWLEENVTSGETLIVDNSLTISGAAADAKVTGDNIRGLKSTLSQPTFEWEAKSMSNDGSISNSQYFVLSKKIPCKPGGKLVNDTPTYDPDNVAYVLYIAVYSGTTFVERVNLQRTREYTLGGTITNFRIMFGHLADSGAIWNDGYLDDLTITYYLQDASYQDFIGFSETVTTDIDSISNLATENAANVQALTFPVSPVWTIGKYISSSGEVKSGTGYALSGMIFCHGGDRVINDTPAKDSEDRNFVFYLVTYATTDTLNDTFITRVNIQTNRDFYLDANVTGARLMFGRSNVVFVEADLDYVDIKMTRKGASPEDMQRFIDSLSIEEGAIWQ